MELPKRKPNRLRNYDYSTPNYYFVTVCTKGKEKLLWNKTTAASVGADAHIGPGHTLSNYGRIVEKYMRTIPGMDKYVIMPNHVHMIIHISENVDGPMWASAPTQGLPQLIRSFKSLSSKECGRSLFQRSYHDHIIRNEADYLRIWQYIDSNPATWENDCFYTEE